MSNRIRSVVGCGPEGCGEYVMRGESDFGIIVESVIVEHGEVCEIRWPDGSTDLWLRE